MVIYFMKSCIADHKIGMRQMKESGLMRVFVIVSRSITNCREIIIIIFICISSRILYSLCNVEDLCDHTSELE